MRTTVTLDDHIYQAATTRARTSGKRLGKVLSEMARHALRDPVPSRFPRFKVPADAPLIATSRIQDFIEEEGVF